MLFSQALFEQKQAYELDLAQARSKYEEEAIHIKENEAEALNEVMEKHRAQLERAHSAAEREKDQLVNVGAQILKAWSRVWKYYMLTMRR